MRNAPLVFALAAAVWLCAEFATRESDAQTAQSGAHEQAAPPAGDQDAAAQDPLGPVPDFGSTLPNEPTKGLVLAYCDHCHGLEWIERSGANEEGWTDRIRRMNRAGAMIPEEQIATLADYLARALPERPRPPEPPKKRENRSATRQGGHTR